MATYNAETGLMVFDSWEDWARYWKELQMALIPRGVGDRPNEWTVLAADGKLLSHRTTEEDAIADSQKFPGSRVVYKGYPGLVLDEVC